MARVDPVPSTEETVPVGFTVVDAVGVVDVPLCVRAASPWLGVDEGKRWSKCHDENLSGSKAVDPTPLICSNVECGLCPVFFIVAAAAEVARRTTSSHGIASRK